MPEMDEKGVQLVRVMPPDGPSVREYFEGILTEKDRAVEMATEEREKAAQALAEALARSIKEGDERLREHISNQIMQIREALASAEKLELERLAVLNTRISDQEKAVDAAFQASEQAIDKAEVNAEKWRDNANEWRGQSADRERTQAEQIATLTSTFLPREVFDAQFTEIRKQLTANTDRLNNTAGEKRGASDFRTEAIAIAAVLVAAVAIIVTIYLAVHK